MKWKKTFHWWFLNFWLGLYDSKKIACFPLHLTQNSIEIWCCNPTNLRKNTNEYRILNFLTFRYSFSFLNFFLCAWLDCGTDKIPQCTFVATPNEVNQRGGDDPSGRGTYWGVPLAWTKASVASVSSPMSSREISDWLMSAVRRIVCFGALRFWLPTTVGLGMALSLGKACAGCWRCLALSKKAKKNVSIMVARKRQGMSAATHE